MKKSLIGVGAAILLAVLGFILCWYCDVKTRPLPVSQPDKAFWLEIAGQRFPANKEISISPAVSQWRSLPGNDGMGLNVAEVRWNTAVSLSEIKVRNNDPMPSGGWKEKLFLASDLDHLVLGVGKREVWFYGIRDDRYVVVSHNNIAIKSPYPQ